ncbi:MAG: hypothetical protein WBG19_02420 [Thermoplasmata archaeon]
MGASTCPGCGAATTPGIAFCTYCGTSLGTAPSAPLPTGTSPFSLPPAPGTPPEPGAAPRARGRRRPWVVLVVLVIVAIVIASVVGFVYLSAPPVQVANIVVWAPDDVCGLSVNAIEFDGFNATIGSNQTFELEMPNYNGTACTIHHLSTNTSGFVVYSAQIPRTIPGSATLPLNVSFHAPGSKYTGNVNIVLR